MLMKAFSMKRLIVALLSICLTSCVVEYTPTGYSSVGYYRYSGSYSSSAYRPYNCYRSYRRPTITPVAHGFDPDPQYVNGYVFRGRDGLPYAAEF